MQFSITTGLFVTFAKAATQLAANDNRRPILAAVRFYNEDEGLSIVATNSYVLGRYQLAEGVATVTEPGSMLVSRAVMMQLIRHIQATPKNQSRDKGTVEFKSNGDAAFDVTITPGIGADHGPVTVPKVRLVEGVYPKIGKLLREHAYVSDEEVAEFGKAELVEWLVASWRQNLLAVLAAKFGDDDAAAKMERLDKRVTEGKGVRGSIDRWLTADELRGWLSGLMAGKTPGLHTQSAFNPNYVSAMVKAAAPITGDHIPLRYYADSNTKPMHVWAVRHELGRFDGMIMPVRV